MSEKVDLEISSVEVKVKTRKLKMIWSSSFDFDIEGLPRKEKVNKWDKLKQKLKENGKANL